MKPITFVIPSRNNFELLKLAYMSIKALEGDNKILVLNDASEDGTTEWLNGLDDRGFLSVHHNPGPERVGIVGMFDKGIEMAETNIICAFHADMVAYPNLDRELLKHVKKGTVVSATRVEPPLHPPGPEKIIEDFGVVPEEFDYMKWCEYKPQELSTKTTEGIFAPWCMYKDDFFAVGGHDKLFAPQSREDSDLFNRFLLNGYKLVQSWDAFVYHFTSRGSRFNPMSGGDIGKDSPEWQKTNSRNERNFIRKWGTTVQHDRFMKPIISPVYDIGLVIHNCNVEFLHALEPWCSNVYIDNEFIVLDYIGKEQENTIIDLSKKCYGGSPYVKKADNDVVIEIDARLFNQTDFGNLSNIGMILADSGDAGEFKLGNLSFKITELEEKQQELIVVDI
jgi:glycosyltransferase involved in cell wall biosynthesis